MAVSRVAIQASLAQLVQNQGIIADANGLLLSSANFSFYSDNRLKILNATHDISLTGNQSITGFGFKPTIVIFIVSASGKTASWGMYDGALSQCLWRSSNDSADTFSINTSLACVLNTALGVYSQFSAISLDGDGVTISWSKTGSPTGTATILIAGFR
ncbi:MAG: hypothetical protein PHH85_01655 [Candidatus Methanoperedens sp.]|nr:hypothetical protein [Candidatus Methanoperedens sp.]